MAARRIVKAFYVLLPLQQGCRKAKLRSILRHDSTGIFFNLDRRIFVEICVSLHRSRQKVSSSENYFKHVSYIKGFPVSSAFFLHC